MSQAIPVPPPRDPSASRARHTRHVIDHDSYVSCYLDWAQAGNGGDLSQIAPELACALLRRYARGDTLEQLREYFLETYVPALAQVRAHQQAHRLAAPVLAREGCESWMLLFALVCFDGDGAWVRSPEDWFGAQSDTVLFSMVLKGFAPGHPYRARYDLKRETIRHELAILSVLLQPRETWPAALDAFMRAWPTLMMKHGYRDQVDDGTAPFNQFPFHVGIAVCAFDIDDSAFRALPWYPRELVDYYRAHVRHTRDAWRTEPINPGAGLPERARPRPKTAPALSKGEAYARWVELVSGGAGRGERARAALGKRKTMPPLLRAMEALAGLGLAIQADIKDDATVETQVHALCAARDLPPPALPAPPPHGPARITALLQALQAHAALHDHQMAVLDDGGDTWNVVLHAAAAADEFADLCEQLALTQMRDSEWA